MSIRYIQGNYLEITIPMAQAPEVIADHRTRVAAERRERMRARLVESAMLVFAEKGVDASVIDDVLAAAEVSRGTFYHYFRTNGELLAAASEELINELLTLIEVQVQGLDNPAARIAYGTRLYLHTAIRYPLFGRFVSRSGFDVDSPSSRFYDFLPPHLEEGMDKGCFKRMPVEVALDLLSGPELVAVYRIANMEMPQDYPEQVVGGILRGLGMSDAQATELTDIPIVPLVPPPDSLLERSQSRLHSVTQRAIN